MYHFDTSRGRDFFSRRKKWVIMNHYGILWEKTCLEAIRSLIEKAVYESYWKKRKQDFRGAQDAVQKVDVVYAQYREGKFSKRP
jgi:hypothetical protein